MIISEEIQRQLLQLFAKSSNATAGQVEQRSAAILQLNPGQQVQAEIVANLPNHRFLARIAGELFNLELPLNLSPGETVELTFVTADPRYTFEFSRRPPGSTVSLSGFGRLLSYIVTDSGTDLQEGTALLHRGSILDAPPADAANFAIKIREALTTSGLFYESHLAEWAAGERLLKEIRMEPQGTLPVLRRGECAMPADGETKIESSDGVKVSKSTEKSDGNAAENQIDPRTIPIIKEQLNLLSSGVLSWRGDVWPGQMLEISVSERERESDREEPRSWETTVELDLKNLGLVKASIQLRASGIFAEICADTPESVAIMNNGANEFMDALAESGLRLEELVIKNANTSS